MKPYSEIRGRIRTGDVLLCEGQGWVSRLIRALTGQQFSHVAVFFWDKTRDNLFLSEFREFKGYRILPASDELKRLQPTTKLHWGVHPGEVTAEETAKITNLILEARQGNTRYSYLELIRVWVSQWTHTKRKSGRVCSTYAAGLWEAMGWHEFTQVADPGDLLGACDHVMAFRISE